MTPEEFCAFCKVRSNTGGIASREVAIQTVWPYIYGQDRTKEEIERFIDDRMSVCRRQSLLDAYAWLKTILNEGAKA